MKPTTDNTHEQYHSSPMEAGSAVCGKCSLWIKNTEPGVEWEGVCVLRSDNTDFRDGCELHMPNAQSEPRGSNQSKT